MSANKTSPFALFERLVVSSALLLCSGEILLFRSATAGGEVSGGESSLIRQVLLFGPYGVIVLLLTFRINLVWRTVQRDGLVWVLVLMAIVSAVWSDAPSVTIHRSLGLVGTTGLGVYLATRYSLTDQLRLLATTLTVAAAASIACALLLPDYGTHGEGWLNAWRGIYIHKNVLGRVMILSTFVMIMLIFDRQQDWFPYVGLLLSVGLLVLSLSKTSLVVVLAVGAIILVYRAYQRSRLFAASLILMASLVAVLALPWLITNFDLVTAAIGKDATLTGRTGIWEVAMEKIANRPWLGYGFYGFWRGWEGESAHVWQVMGLAVAHGHNGFLDICLDMGLVGLSVFALGFMLAFFRAMARLKLTDSMEGLWPLAFLTLLFFYNMTESALLKEHNLYWALYVSAVLSRPGSISIPSAPRPALLSSADDPGRAPVSTASAACP